MSIKTLPDGPRSTRSTAPRHKGHGKSTFIFKVLLSPLIEEFWTHFFLPLERLVLNVVKVSRKHPGQYSRPSSRPPHFSVLVNKELKEHSPPPQRSLPVNHQGRHHVGRHDACCQVKVQKFWALRIFSFWKSGLEPRQLIFLLFQWVIKALLTWANNVLLGAEKPAY